MYDDLMEGRVILLGDFNAYSTEWNPHCGENRDAAGIEVLIERHDPILNNELGKAIRPTRRNPTSIIDFTFTTLKIRALDA